jgi:hypothetical protein
MYELKEVAKRQLPLILSILTSSDLSGCLDRSCRPSRQSSRPRRVAAGPAADALADSAVHQQLADLGYRVVPRHQQTPEWLRAFHKAEIEKWWPIIKAANIRAANIRAM